MARYRKCKEIMKEEAVAHGEIAKGVREAKTAMKEAHMALSNVEKGLGLDEKEDRIAMKGCK